MELPRREARPAIALDCQELAVAHSPRNPSLVPIQEVGSLFPAQRGQHELGGAGYGDLCPQLVLGFWPPVVEDRRIAQTDGARAVRPRAGRPLYRDVGPSGRLTARMPG